MDRHPMGWKFFDFLVFSALAFLTFHGAEAVNVTTTGWSRTQCNGPFNHGIHLHAYHISSAKASTGMTNKNAADTLGDIAFIFGSKGIPNPRGVAQYSDGIIEMVHLSVSSWGDYLQCNHPDGSTVYSCKCPKAHKGSCDMKRAGKEQNSHSNGHLWYSFPKAGHGTYWDYEYFGEHRGCRRMAFHASCVIDSLAKAAGCKVKCGPDTSKECVDCVNKLSEKEKEHVWDEAVFKGGCSDLNSPNDPLNRRRARRRSGSPRRRRSSTRRRRRKEEQEVQEQQEAQEEQEAQKEQEAHEEQEEQEKDEQEEQEAQELHI